MSLPFGVVIYSSDEVTERMSRRIGKARQKMTSIGLDLEEKGYLAPIPEEWDEEKREKQARLNLRVESDLSDADLDAFDHYQSELILTMVESWDNGELCLDNLLDLKKADFEELASLCDKALRGTVIDKEPSPDPKAPAADSPV